MRIASWLLPVLVLLFPGLPAHGQTPQGRSTRETLPIPKNQSTPRETLETFCFAWDAFKLGIPGASEVAESCLILPNGATTWEKSQFVIFLGETIDLLSPPFSNVTANIKGERAEASIDPLLPITLERMTDGNWKFNSATMAAIGTIHQKAIDQNKVFQAQRALMAEGLGDPTELGNTFLERALAGDFESAAQCLDLRGLPPEKRKTEGPLLAWKLAAIIQRLGYMYNQDLPVDPLRPPYAWYAGPEGNIISARIHLDNQLDKWVFQQDTVKNIDSMWDGLKKKTPNVRWRILGHVVRDPSSDANWNPEGLDRPKDLEPQFSSPRQMIQGFLRSIDTAEHSDSPLDEAATFLDLSDFSLEDGKRLGPKLAEKLEILLRKVKPPIQEMDDHWTAPQVIFGDKSFKIRIVKRSNGRWGFSTDTVSRIPAMFDSLSGQERGQTQLKNISHASPRDTFSSFIRAMNAGKYEEAAKSLDLEAVPLTARNDIGPLLAIKLKLLIDATGHVYFHEIPSDSEGPRYIWQRGPYARIVLSRRADQPEAGWRFTDSTVSEIDQGLLKLTRKVQSGEPVGPDFDKGIPSWREAPGIRLRLLVPWQLSKFIGPLEIWQWIGLILLPIVLVLFFLMMVVILDPIIGWMVSMKTAANRRGIRQHLRAIRVFLTMIIAYWIIPFIDLPNSFNVFLFTTDNILLTIAGVLTGFGLVDLVILWSNNHKKTKSIRGFQELLLPFFGRIVKVGLVLGSLIYIVSSFDDGALLGRFLAGLGVIGLAVSLAAQDSLKNLFATMLLISDRNFSVGDLIRVGNFEGIVQTVGFRSTIIKTKEDSLVIIPNGVIAGGTIDNLGARNFRLVQGTVTLAADTCRENLHKYRDQLSDWLLIYPGIDKDRCQITINGFSDKGVEVQYKVYVMGKSGEDATLRESLTLKIMEIADTNGIRLTKTA